MRWPKMAPNQSQIELENVSLRDKYVTMPPLVTYNRRY